MDRLKMAQLQAALGKIYKNKEADFFKEMPPELRQNYNIYQQRRAAYAKAGHPLPPGGSFILGNEAVVGGCMAELHSALARMLGLPPDHINLRLARGADGFRVEADITMPKDYTLPMEVVGQSPVTTQAEVREIYRQYMDSVVTLLNEQFRKDVALRSEANLRVNPDLEQPLSEKGWHDEENPEPDSN